MSKWDKNLTSETFRKPTEKNNKWIILVPINAYGIGIDNPDVKLVLQLDIPLSLNSMIQCMGRAGKNDGASVFILLTSK